MLDALQDYVKRQTKSLGILYEMKEAASRGGLTELAPDEVPPVEPADPRSVLWFDPL